jgi:hypothetical protein
MKAISHETWTSISLLHLQQRQAQHRWGISLGCHAPDPACSTERRLGCNTAARRRNPKSATGFSKCRGSTESRVPHWAGFDAPLIAQRGAANPARTWGTRYSGPSPAEAPGLRVIRRVRHSDRAWLERPRAAISGSDHRDSDGAPMGVGLELPSQGLQSRR